MGDDIEKELDLNPIYPKTAMKAIISYSFYAGLITSVWVRILMNKSSGLLYFGSADDIIYVIVQTITMWLIYLVVVAPVVMIYRKKEKTPKWEWVVGIFIPLFILMFFSKVVGWLNF